MELNFLNVYSKDFITETSQIQAWINYLLEIKYQANIFRESTENESKIHETFGKGIIGIIKSYYNDTSVYNDDPSQLYYASKLFGTIVEESGKSLSQDILMLNIHVNKYIENMNKDVEKLIGNITRNSCFYMDELNNIKKNYKNIQAKYLKLKSDIEEAHMVKKKIEVDPKLIYNISLKEKAEQKILILLKEMQIILPDFNNVTKEVDNKKTAFNKLMKETFELVVGCVFKNHVKIREVFFLISKEKEEIYSRLKDITIEKLNQIKEINLLLNDFAERKYAEIKNIFYDSIENLEINDDEFLPNNLLKISETLLLYAENFYNLIKKRKRILKEFYKFLNLLSKLLENFSCSCLKITNQIQIAIQNLKDISKSTEKSWDVLQQQYNFNNNSHSSLAKFLLSTANINILKTAKEIKGEYVKFIEKWGKFLKLINAHRPQVQKLQLNRTKIIQQINELRGNVADNSLIFDKTKINSKNESKISQLKDEENSIKDSLNVACKKFKEVVVQSLEFIKSNSKAIREIEAKKLRGCIQILENIGTNFKDIYEQNLDFMNMQTDMCASNDIYEEVKDIFDNYIDKYSITDKYFDIIIKKIIRNNSFASDDYAKEKLNSFIAQKEKGNFNSYNFMSQIDSGNIANIGNFGNRKDSAAYENFISIKNKAFQSVNPIGNFNNINAFSNNLNTSSHNCSPVNLNFSNNEELLRTSPEKKKRGSINYGNFCIDLQENRIDLNEKNKIVNNLFNNLKEFDSNNNNLNLNQFISKDSSNTPIYSVLKSKEIENLRRKTASFALENENVFQNGKGFEGNMDNDDINQANYTFNSENREKSELSNNAILLDEYDRMEYESDLQKSPNGKLENEQNFINQNAENFNSSSLLETFGSIEEEKLNFINLENFKVLEDEGYSNIKENEIKEYMDKLTSFKINVKKEKVGKDPKAGNFVLEQGEQLLDSYSCAYADKILLQGKLYVTTKKLAFRSMFNNKTFFGTTKLIIPLSEIERIDKKYNLKIFDNSLEVVTKKAKLFFTSFVSRDQCFNTLTELVQKFKRENNDPKNEINEENDENLYDNRQGLRKNINLNIAEKILKKLDFLKRLDLIHKENLENFDKSNTYKPMDFYKNIYFVDEPLGNVALPVIYNYIYNQDNICEELKCGKTFWESLFILRKDYDMSIDINSKNVPNYYSDLDYLISKLSNFEEENLNEFLYDCSNWSLKPNKYTYKYIHPIKKKMFGPEKVQITNEFYVYFISPKMFIVEEISYSEGFTYCDYFVSMAQWRFNCDFKFDLKANVFKFMTKINVGFQIHFLKSCMFKNMIETEGANESSESIRFNIYEKFRLVIDSQSLIFNEYFNKMTEENIHRLAKTYKNDENEIENFENVENENNEDLNNDNNKKNHENGHNSNIENKVDEIQKEKKKVECVKILNYEVEKKFFIKVSVYSVFVLFMIYTLKLLFIDWDFSFDKFINTLLFGIIFFIFTQIYK